MSKKVTYIYICVIFFMPVAALNFCISTHRIIYSELYEYLDIQIKDKVWIFKLLKY